MQRKNVVRGVVCMSAFILLGAGCSGTSSTSRTSAPQVAPKGDITTPATQDNQPEGTAKAVMGASVEILP